MKEDKKYTIEQLRSAWGAGKYSASEGSYFSEENVLENLKTYEFETKKKLISLLVSMEACSEDEIEKMKDYDTTADAIWSLNDKFPEPNTKIDCILQLLWSLNEFSSNIRIEYHKRI